MGKEKKKSQFEKRLANPFNASFSRASNGGGMATYRTSFWMPGSEVFFVETIIDERKAHADGLDTPQIVESVKGDHYNKVTTFLHERLVKVLNVETV